MAAEEEDKIFTTDGLPVLAKEVGDLSRFLKYTIKKRELEERLLTLMDDPAFDEWLVSWKMTMRSWLSEVTVLEHGESGAGMEVTRLRLPSNGVRTRSEAKVAASDEPVATRRGVVREVRISCGSSCQECVAPRSAGWLRVTFAWEKVCIREMGTLGDYVNIYYYLTRLHSIPYNLWLQVWLALLKTLDVKFYYANYEMRLSAEASCREVLASLRSSSSGGGGTIVSTAWNAGAFADHPRSSIFGSRLGGGWINLTWEAALTSFPERGTSGLWDLVRREVVWHTLSESLKLLSPAHYQFMETMLGGCGSLTNENLSINCYGVEYQVIVRDVKAHAPLDETEKLYALSLYRRGSIVLFGHNGVERKMDVETWRESLETNIKCDKTRIWIECLLWILVTMREVWTRIDYSSFDASVLNEATLVQCGKKSEVVRRLLLKEKMPLVLIDVIKCYCWDGLLQVDELDAALKEQEW